ncbi:MAG: CsgG/HfaB family protein, partial [Treponema sp.]|nr:CsgG/HfaB family protein [Treponema sp.]
MKSTFKKIALLGALIIGILGSLNAAPMNSKYGYFDLAWGSTLAQVKMKGYEIEPMDEDVVASEQPKYKGKLTMYILTNKKDKFVNNVVFSFHDGKLIAVTEILNKSMANASKLAARYGKFSEIGIWQPKDNKNFFLDYTYDDDGNFTNGSIHIQIAGDTVEVHLMDYATCVKVNRKTLKMSGKATIADMLYELAGDLVKNTDKSKKISMAFVALSSDAQNKFVENYVTDALTQSVFETGNVRIIERANLEKILKEQKFQSSGLVDDSSAKAIGKIAGVDYVCYGDM